MAAEFAQCWIPGTTKASYGPLVLPEGPCYVTNTIDLDLALGRLSPDDRELVRLWAWERLAPREIDSL